MNECDDRDEDFIAAAPKKRAFAPSYRSVLARDASRHLFAGQPPAKETRVVEQRQAIELLPKIKTAIGSIGMANHVIRSLVSGCGSYRHCVYNSFRNSVRIAARIFGSKRHRVLFPYFNGLYYSIPQQSPLALAIQATALSYLKSGSNPSNVQTAVKTGNTCLVAAMLDSGVTADSKVQLPFWESSETHLHIAASSNQCQVMKWLLSSSSLSLEVRDFFGNTPLHCAVKARASNIIKILLARGAAINVPNNSNQTPLHLACYHGHESAVEILLNAGASVSACDNLHLHVPLHMAVVQKRDAAALLLISRLACIEAPDENFDTPLHLAAKLGNTKVVAALLKAGANIESQNINRITPLMAACSVEPGIETSRDCIETLLSSGANMNAIDAFHWTPLHHASRYGCRPAILSLLSAAVSVDVVDLEQRTALYLASCAGHSDCVDALLQASASVSRCDAAKRTALHMAAMKNHREIVRLLLAAGADANTTDCNLMTPLHLAAQHGHDSIIQLLLDSRADVNTLDVNMYSALHWAVANDHVSSAAKLAGAGVSAVNHANGLSIAKSRSNFNIASVINRLSPEPQCAA